MWGLEAVRNNQGWFSSVRAMMVMPEIWMFLHLCHMISLPVAHVYKERFSFAAEETPGLVLCYQAVKCCMCPDPIWILGAELFCLTWFGACFSSVGSLLNVQVAEVLAMAR